DLNHLESLASSLNTFINSDYCIAGIGGGTVCDTAKFIAWYVKDRFQYDLDLILIPSIISVDAFLCSSIAVRINNKVNYIGESNPEQIIIDFNLIKKAPKRLNRAGVSDTISIASALGDWLIAKEENDEKFNKNVFERAKNIAIKLMKAREEINQVSEKGIESLVNGFYEEVVLCEEWGNARPEEGSEHFLAYCLEALTGDHYIHGNLIGMNILISLFLQEQYAQFSVEEIGDFFRDISLEFSPEQQNISYEILKTVLKRIKSYVVEEKLHYSIYNSPQLFLDDDKIENIITFIKSQ
ncbi:MAG: iron-containing alcohol dehydrogenase, partial [Candidatus Lokiarchaeota archaeon]|nr:iron-containing alcohol dehydrogenase [Candidatus Lokiarchaeota archaeon]MBD3341202.1 iron-containing alcohol dehydrogenase [Candidatus Lokiarchaeota archaeon]